MATGYTAELQENDMTFEAFALLCARAFGATITMRDDSLDAPIPEEFEPSAVYAKDVDEREKQLTKIRDWTDEQAEQKSVEAFQEAVRSRKDVIAKNAAVRARYEGMIARVEAWTPPTDEHVGLKEFMLNQLRESIDFDCSYVPKEPVKLNGQLFKEYALAEATQSLAYARKSYAEEIERTQSRTKWLRLLRESLKAPFTTAEAQS